MLLLLQMNDSGLDLMKFCRIGVSVVNGYMTKFSRIIVSVVNSFFSRACFLGLQAAMLHEHGGYMIMVTWPSLAGL